MSFISVSTICPVPPQDQDEKAENISNNFLKFNLTQDNVSEDGGFIVDE